MLEYLLRDVSYFMKDKVIPSLIASTIVFSCISGALYSCKKPQLEETRRPEIVQQQDKKPTFEEYAKKQMKYSVKFPEVE